MNCAYHSINTAVVNCNGCGKPLCPACDHRIKGFPYCQNCIVDGVEMLRNRGNGANYVPLVKKQTSPLLALILSLICPGLGAAYNGQTSKALVYFSIFIGLFQLAILLKMPIFVLGFIGMWFFAAIDSWRTAQLIRSGVTPDGAEDIIVQRFSGNPKLWGFVLLGLGSLFFLQMFVNVGQLLRSAIPVLLVALGFYLLRDRLFKNKTDDKKEEMPDYSSRLSETSFRTGDFEVRNEQQNQTSSKSWKSR